MTMFLVGLVTAPEVWLAGNDLLVEGQWMWADDRTPLTYTNWTPGQPDNWGHYNPLAHCLGLFNGAFTWDDENCESLNNPLCRHPYVLRFIKIVQLYDI